ncbi:DUF5389 family protein [Phocoenobacter uteri]|uniref:DUF5389 family protein n=1 Tax=Phocoenobacter uteri TaxID=146806 RepID=UPI0011C073D9|nr:DUF5389 family protein [Phocoenobacter uteri]
MNSSFSKFSWALVGLCLPCALWPLALLLTPALSNVGFSGLWLNILSISLWVYPFILFYVAYLLHKSHKNNNKSVKFWLLISYIIAYGYWGYIFSLI